MKKVYALGMALAVAATAVAAPKNVSSKVETMSQFNAEASYVQVPSQKKAQGPAKAVTSVDDVCGLVSYTARGWLGGDGNPKFGPQQGVGMITKKDANTVYIAGCPWQNVPVTLNITAKTFTILNNQMIGTNGSGGDPVYIYTYEMTPAADGKYSRKSVSSIKGTIADDGTLVFPESAALGWSDPSNEPNGSFFYLNNEYVFEKTPYNTPKNADDYELVGTGDYFDGFFNPVFVLSGAPEVAPYEVEIYKNKTDENIIAVKNPYMASEEFKSTFSDLHPVDGGWFLFNIEEPACVQMVPLVNCGMIDEDEETGEISHYYPFNQEGYNTYIEGMSIEDVLFQYELAFEECSNISEEEDGTSLMSLTSLFFGVEEAPTGFYWWSKDENERFASLTLPAGIVGIKGVSNDAVNGVTKYYNLQGVEISNPVKGQLVIVKNGKKAVKQIIK